MLLTYRFLTSILYPILILIIYIRVFLKKEHGRRFKEKISINHFNIKRDFKKKLIWIHVASIGELQSVLPLINKITKTSQNIEILITTVTLSSANLLKKKFKELENDLIEIEKIREQSLKEAYEKGYEEGVKYTDGLIKDEKFPF